MEKKIKKENKIIPNKPQDINQNKNNFHQMPKKNNIKSLRPSSKTKTSNKNQIINTRKSNTPKSIPIINLNEGTFHQKESKELNEKQNPKKAIKKENFKKINYNANINNNAHPSISKNLSTMEQITNLTSLYNSLLFINNKLDSSFASQRQEAEKSLNNKYSEAIELKEKNFKIFQQINSIANIIDIDDYFVNNYSKMMDVYPKASNVAENMNDIVSNINYSIDRMYLVDDLLCDQNILQNNIIQIKNDFEIMNRNIEEKIEEINSNKMKYEELFNKLKYSDEEIKKIENKLGSFKQDILTSNIEIIHRILSDKNQKLLNEILND